MNNKTIQTKVQETIKQRTTQLINDKIPDDLMGLYGDIRVELFQKVPDNENMIDDYANLLEKEQQIYSPEIAYQVGLETAQSGGEYNPKKYFNEVYSSSDNQKLFNERDNIFHNICNLLGDTKGLIIEYTELYRLFHGVINEKIHLFYDWGYYGKFPICEENAG